MQALRTPLGGGGGGGGGLTFLRLSFLSRLVRMKVTKRDSSKVDHDLAVGPTTPLQAFIHVRKDSVSTIPSRYEAPRESQETFTACKIQ